MSNRAKGNKFEKELCDILSKHGFWVHNFAQNSAGQPADIIAVMNGTPVLIDCKDCDKEYFPFSRVEDNQRLAMKHWIRCGNAWCYFAVKVPNGTIYMIPYNLISMYEDVFGKTSFEKKDFAIGFRTLTEWLGVMECSQELETISK